MKLELVAAVLVGIATLTVSVPVDGPPGLTLRDEAVQDIEPIHIYDGECTAGLKRCATDNATLLNCNKESVWVVYEKCTQCCRYGLHGYADCYIGDSCDKSHPPDIGGRDTSDIVVPIIGNEHVDEKDTGCTPGTAICGFHMSPSDPTWKIAILRCDSKSGSYLWSFDCADASHDQCCREGSAPGTASCVCGGNASSKTLEPSSATALPEPTSSLSGSPSIVAVRKDPDIIDILMRSESNIIQARGCQPGTTKCMIIRETEYIVVCKENSYWAISAICGYFSDGCCQQGPTPGTSFCICGGTDSPEASGLPSTTALLESSPSLSSQMPTFAVRNTSDATNTAIHIERSDECQPGTAECGIFHGVEYDTVAIFLCDASGNWLWSVNCAGGADGQCCQTGPTPGTAFCVCGPYAGPDSSPSLSSSPSIVAMRDTSKALETVAHSEDSEMRDHCTPGVAKCDYTDAATYADMKYAIFLCDGSGNWQWSVNCADWYHPACCQQGPIPGTAFCVCGPYDPDAMPAAPQHAVEASVGTGQPESPPSISARSAQEDTQPSPPVLFPEQYCEHPGTYTCSTDYAYLGVCDSNHQYEVSAYCGGPNRCSIGPQPGTA